MAVRRKTIKRTVGPALYQVMEPGDQIVAGTWAMAGPGPWLDVVGAVPIAAALAAVGVAETAPGTRPDVFNFFWHLAPSLLPLVTMIMRRPVFVAVTERQLICYRLNCGW